MSAGFQCVGPSRKDWPEGYRRCLKCSMLKHMRVDSGSPTRTCAMDLRVPLQGRDKPRSRSHSSEDQRMAAKQQNWMACAVAVATVMIGAAAPGAAADPPSESRRNTSTESPALAGYGPRTGRFLYAVNQAAATRGSMSVYDIGAGHRLVRTIETVRDADDVKGVAASAATGRLYVAYRTRSGVGMIYCLNAYDDTVLWNRIGPSIPISIGYRFTRTDSSCTFRPGKAPRLTLSTS